MYKVGDHVIYGGVGVCLVSDITTCDIAGIDKDDLYYVLKPVYQDSCTIYAQTNEKVFMRAVVSKEEADRLIDLIPSMQVEAYHSHVTNELEQHYKKSINSHELLELIELTMSTYAKKQEALELKKKFGAVDERFMKQAEDLLFSELAVVYGIPKESVHAYIDKRINGEAQELQEVQEELGK
ncbi:MAG: CarD family transcriptional regulator [Clostridioides sp.]|jgi:CarD family transcriptional regulator|nr:CarD family transcriptional regulator [Clostridioides sp.]